MNKATVMAAIVAATILATGCRKDHDPVEPQEEERTALNVTGDIETPAGAPDFVWESGDAIGIFLLNAGTNVICEGAANRKYVTTKGDGCFGPDGTSTDQTIYLPFSGKTDLLAYFPWQSITLDATGGYLYVVDVSNQTNQKAIDLMTAKKVTDKDNEEKDAAFEFAHQLVKITLSSIVAGDGLTADELKGLTVKLTGQHTRGTYDVVGSSLTVDGGGVVATAKDATTPPTDLPLLVATDSQSAEAIVLPAASTAGMELVFRLQSGAEYRWAVADADQSSKFLSGNKYNYHITIAKKYINVTSSITDWATGNGEGESGTAQ